MLDRLTPPSEIDTGEVKHGFDLGEALSFAWRQWKFVASVAALVFVVGTVYLLRQTPLYTATSQVLLDQQREKLPGGEVISPDTNLNVGMVETQMAIIRSTVFLRRVVENQHLADDLAFAGRVSPGPPTDSASTESPSILDSVRSFVLPRIGKSRAEETPPESKTAPTMMSMDTVAPNEQSAIGALSGMLKVSRVAQEGYVLAISVTSPSPAQAARLANAVADGYLVEKLDTRFEAAKRAAAWLSDQLLELRTQLRHSEEAITQFRAERGLVDSGNVTLTQQQLSDLNRKLIDARADFALKKAHVVLLDALQAKGGSLGSMPDIGGEVLTLQQQADALSAKLAYLLAHYNAEHAIVVNVRTQLNDVERSISLETQRLADRLGNDYQLAEARVTSLEGLLREATGQTNLDNATAIRLRELERTAVANKALFEDFLKQSKITQVQSTFEPQDVRVITPALPPAEPSYPRKTQLMAVNLFIGLFLGIGAALAKEKLNTGFTTPRQIKDQLGLPVLAWVSGLKTRDLHVDQAIVQIYEYPLAKPLSRFGEAIRSLRSGINMTDVDHPPKVIQVTSAVRSEGKTTIALSLAVSAANAKLKVLFIDADLRHSTATHVFGLQNAPGLVDFLLGAAGVQDVIRFHEQSGFWALGAGAQTQSPTDLLGSQPMKSMIAEFKEAYDLVLIDTPPAGPVSDPVVLSQLSDKLVLVVRWGKTARELIKQCVDQLSGHGKIAGVVFNQVNERQAKKYGRDASLFYYGTRYYNSYHSQ